MNSEELEMSLRTEFESHLKDVFAGMRQEFSHFQEQINAEFDKHKSQLDAVFQEFSARLGTGKDLDQGFKETVVEHLRLARDEGARITATALAEAEDMQRQSAPTEMLPPLQPPTQTTPSVGISELRDAINDITAQDSQGTILKSLVQHAAQFTPRGAFFIIKNEHFVGWRVFNKEGAADEDAVRDIYLPVASETVLGESVRSLSAVESSYGTYSDDSAYLNRIGFGEPEKMIAIPLVARGRGVAVLYADEGSEGAAVNIEALETLVRVAGLTVEVLASFSSAPKSVQTEAQAAVQPEEARQETEAAIATPVEINSPVAEPAESVTESVSQTEEATEAVEARTEETAEAVEMPSEETAEYQAEGDAEVQEIFVEPIRVIEDSEEPETTGTRTDSAMTTDFQVVGEQTAAQTSEPAEYQTQTFKTDDFSGTFEKSNDSATYAPEPAIETPAASVRSRFSDRNVDLPIEVSEDERRLHNDARRFARLLVSEIKLYNEQKVKEGRESQDLYDRLREAIDRSRDMYDKRVQPPVSAKFDYFHYELVSTLAEGEPTKLGNDYPGAMV